MPGLLDRQIFRPAGSVDARPEDLGLDYEEVFLTAADGVRLHAWFFPGKSGVTLVFFHGNAGDVTHRLDMIPLLQAGLDASILLFDYRGYGRSEGAPTERGVYLDSLAAAQWAREREGTRAVVYYGRSLGAAAAIETALREPPNALVVEAAFLSIAEMAAVSHPFIGLVSWLWLRGRFDNASKISKLRAPLLVIHGDQDDTVPLEHGLRLYKAAPWRKELYIVRGAGHSDALFVDGDKYTGRISRFLHRYLPGGASSA